MRFHVRSRRLGALSPNQALLAAAVFAAVAAPATAQLQFEELPGRELPSPGDAANAVSFGDVDGDGDLDAIFASGTYPNGQNRLYVNDGNGTFTDVTAAQMPVDSSATNAAVFGDVDGDGDADMVFGNTTQNHLYINDGSGTFTDVTATQMPVDVSITMAVALGDVDGDGDLDMVCANAVQYGGTSQNHLYVNDGSGTFTDATATQMPADTDTTHAVALADIDGDNDLDMVLGNAGYQYLGPRNRLYLNDGSGTFTDVTGTQLPPDIGNTVGVAVGDLDGDGDNDFVTANSGFGGGKYSFFGRQNRLYINDGNGTFTDFTSSQMPLVADQSDGVALGDIDGDSDLDIVVANGSAGYFGFGESNRVYLNDGTANFIDVSMPRLPGDTDVNTALALGDVDADGDLDMLLGSNGYASQNRLYFNLQRQLQAPEPFAIGQTYTLDGYMRYGPTSQNDFALPYIAPNLASVPLPPFGTIGIDPASMVPLPLFTIPQPAGIGSVSIAVPIIPGLLGVSFHSQALMVPAPLLGTLSNVVSDEYVPLPPPVIDNTTPPVAGPGVPVTVNGTNFLNGLTLTVGGNPTPITSWTATTVNFVMPPGNICDTLVEVANLVNSTDSILMNGTPIVTNHATSGPAAGGGLVYIIGHHLQATTVTFNGVPMTNITSQGPTAIVGQAPPGSPGQVTVLITNSNGCLTTFPYTYL